jgi:hypothetical protein
MTKKEQFLELSTKIQNEALKVNNYDLFVQISELNGIMFDITTVYFSKGIDKAQEIIKKYN